MGEFVVVESFGKIADHLAVAVVFDVHAVAEGAEKVLMAFHEPHLQEVLTDEVLCFHFQDFVHVGNLILDRLFLQKDEPEIADFSKGGKGRLVEVSLFETHPLEHVGDQGGVDFVVDLVCFHRH